MLKYDIARLQASSPGRPKGFVEFVLEHGKIECDFVLLDDGAQNELSKQFPSVEFEIAQLKADAKLLPKGFADFVLSHGKIEDGLVRLDY